MGRATLTSRLKRLELATAVSRRCTICDRKLRVAYVNKIDGGEIIDADMSPCPECGRPPIVLRFVDMLPDEARERQRGRLLLEGDHAGASRCADDDE